MTIPAAGGLYRPFNDMAELVNEIRGRRIVHIAADGSLVWEQAGALVLFDAADMNISLPAITAAEIGLWFDFASTIIGTDQEIIAAAGDLLTGGVGIISSTAGGSDTFSPNGSSHLTLSMNGTTKGGVAPGGWLRYVATSATSWLVTGILFGSGTLITPFS
jgi:hypothetical protein